MADRNTCVFESDSDWQVDKSVKMILYSTAPWVLEYLKVLAVSGIGDTHKIISCIFRVFVDEEKDR